MNADVVAQPWAERGFACLAVRVDEGATLGGQPVYAEYVGRVPMRVPLGVRPATGEPVPWSDLGGAERADPANAAGPRLWSALSQAQRRSLLVAACRAERERSVAPPPDDVAVTLGGQVTI